MKKIMTKKTLIHYIENRYKNQLLEQCENIQILDILMCQTFPIIQEIKLYLQNKSRYVFILRRFEKLLKSFELKVYPPNSTVFSQGDVGLTMYFVMEGELIACNQHKTMKIAKGDYFGEHSLHFKCNRTATIKTVSDAVLLLIKSEDYERYIFDFIEMNIQSTKWLLNQNKLFTGWTAFEVSFLLQYFTKQSFEQNQTIYSAESSNRKLYLIEMGRVGIYMNNLIRQPILQYEVSTRSCFGELEFLKNQEWVNNHRKINNMLRTTTARALEKTTAYCIPFDIFIQIQELYNPLLIVYFLQNKVKTNDHPKQETDSELGPSTDSTQNTKQKQFKIRLCSINNLSTDVIPLRDRRVSQYSVSQKLLQKIQFNFNTPQAAHGRKASI